MPGFNHTTENMKTKTLLGFFLLSVMAFCVSACQDDAEIILFTLIPQHYSLTLFISA